MKVLIAGAGGQLGRELTENLRDEYEVLALPSVELDVTRLDWCLEAVDFFRPALIINAAALTRVDDCETLAEQAFKVNASGARNLALAAERVAAKYLYVSTDYVFNGTSDRPYCEFDHPDPINLYGRSKFAGEQLTRTMTHRHFIVRTSWMFGRYGKNFVKTILRLAREQSHLHVVDDQRSTPTSAADLTWAIRDLIGTDRYGTYHLTNQGSCTWYQFASEILRKCGSRSSVVPISSDRLSRPAKRPSYTVLDGLMWRSEGLPTLRPWQEALEETLRHLEGGSST